MEPNFSNFTMEMNTNPDPNTGSAMSADTLWKTFDNPSITQQLSPMYPFHINNPGGAQTFGSVNSSGMGSGGGGGGGGAGSESASNTSSKSEPKNPKRNSTKGDSTSGSKSSMKKKQRSALSEAEKVARREKHNQVEIRRRKRINQRFTELGEICGCDSKQKRNILTSAIDKLKEFEDRIQQLKGNLESLALDDSAAEAGDVDGDEKVDADLQFQQDHSVVDHRSVFMKSGVPLHVSGFDGRILDCNEKFAQLFGFTRDVILANQVTVFSLTAPDSLAVTFGVVGHLMKGNPRAQVDNLMIGPGGRLIKVKVTAWLIRDNGRPKYFMSMMVPDPNFQAPAGAATAPNALQISPTSSQASSNNNSMMPFLAQPGSSPPLSAPSSLQLAPQMSLSTGPLQLQLPAQALAGPSLAQAGMMRGQSADSLPLQQQALPQQQQQQQQHQQQQLLYQQLLQMQQAQQSQGQGPAKTSPPIAPTQR